MSAVQTKRTCSVPANAPPPSAHCEIRANASDMSWEDGSEATETIRLSLDNSDYEIDLNEGHANELRRPFERFRNAGRKVSGGRGRPAARSKSSQGVLTLKLFGYGLLSRVFR